MGAFVMLYHELLLSMLLIHHLYRSLDYGGKGGLSFQLFPCCTAGLCPFVQPIVLLGCKWVVYSITSHQ
jgi:hypothetical protein